jgi:hypothetical protein
MPTFRVTSPDGKTYDVTGPEGSTAEQALEQVRMQVAGGGGPAPEKPRTISDRATQMAGDIGAGLARGANRVVDTLGGVISAAVPDNPIYRSQRSAFDAANQNLERGRSDRLAFQAGDVGGQVLATAPVGAVLGGIAGAAGAPAAITNALGSAGMRTGVPMNALADLGIRSAAGAAVGGVSAGLVDPQQALTGAAVGGALPGAMQLAGRAGQALGSAVSVRPANTDLARKAIDQYGIPLGVADVSDNAMVKGLRSVLNDTPFVGRIGQRQGEAVQQGFNRAVGETFGAAEPSLTPQVLDAAKKRMGGEFDRIWNNNALAVDGDMIAKLSDLQNAAAKLPRSEGASLNAEVQDLLSKAVTDASGNTIIPGDAANKFQSYLRRRAEGSVGLRNELNDLRQTIIGAFNRSVSPDDAAALTLNRQQYKAFKTVEPLLQGAEAGVAGRITGDVPAGLLPQAVRRSYGGGISGSPFEDLSQIGSQFVADRVARTGGSPRAMVQNSMIGGALGAGAFSNPLAALAAIPAAGVAQRVLGSPALGRAVLNEAQQNTLARLLADPQVQAAIARAAPVAVTAP